MDVCAYRTIFPQAAAHGNSFFMRIVECKHFARRVLTIQAVLILSSEITMKYLMGTTPSIYEDIASPFYLWHNLRILARYTMTYFPKHIPFLYQPSILDMALSWNKLMYDQHFHMIIDMGIIKDDMYQCLKFIRKSPLKKTFPLAIVSFLFFWIQVVYLFIRIVPMKGVTPMQYFSVLYTIGAFIRPWLYTLGCNPSIEDS
jgi:hypothetical protein